MIKYNTNTGDKTVNTKARQQVVIFKLILKGMHCRKHKQDTVFDFYNDMGYPGHTIHACCDEFKQRIDEKLNAPRLP